MQLKYVLSIASVAFGLGVATTLLSTGTVEIRWTASSKKSVPPGYSEQDVSRGTQTPASDGYSQAAGQGLEAYQIVLPGMDLEQARTALYQYYRKAPGIPVEHHSDPRGEIIVVFDALCPKCHELYELLRQREDLAINSYWVPAVVFADNADSLHINSLLTDIAMSSIADGRKAIDSVMARDFRFAQGPAAVRDKARYFTNKATAGLYQAVNGVEGGGTPLVLFRNAHGIVEVIAEVPSAEQLGRAQLMD